MFDQYKRPLKFIFESFKGHRKLFVFFLLGKVIEGAFYVVLPIFAKLEMDQLVEKNEQLFGIIELDAFSIFIVILSIIFIINFFENLLKSFINLFQFDYVKIYDNFYAKSLYNKLEKSEPGIFLNSRNKRFINEILGESDLIGQSIREFIGDFITNIFVLIGIFTVLSLINIWIFVILVLSGIVMYLLEKYRQKIIQKVDFEEKYEYEDKLRVVTNQLSRNFNQLISSGGFIEVLNKFENYNDELRLKLRERQKTNLILDLISFITENIAQLAIKVFVGYSIFFAGLSIGTMTMTLLYVGRINNILTFFRRARFGMIDFSANLDFLNLFLDITETKKNKNIKESAVQKLTFNNVSFSYPNFSQQELKYLEIVEKRIKKYGFKTRYSRDELHMVEEARKEVAQETPVILKNINLEFINGKTYGIVGKNGAGKTTIISLIQNFFDNYEGEILIDGKQVREFSRGFFEDNISVINQEPYIVNGFSVRDNILLGVREEIPDDIIFKYLKKFKLKDKVLKMRNGLDARIGYDNDFSGGEKQLLVLIRIILQDKKILIMDEGTNQLDAENEIKVMQELLKHRENKIVIFITHRMTSIKKVDKIYCLDNGVITASGTPNELIGKDNLFNEFWDMQVGK